MSCEIVHGAALGVAGRTTVPHTAAGPCPTLSGPLSKKCICTVSVLATARLIRGPGEVRALVA